MAREMKDSGIEWIGEMPRNWDIAPLKRFAKIQTGNTPSKTDEELFYADEGTPWIKPDNLGTGFPITYTTEYLTPEGCNVARVMPPNTVYVCCIGSLGKVGYSQVKCCCNQQINALIFNDKMFWKFGYYLTLAQESRYLLYGNGNVLQIINSTNQGNIECVVPSIKEQKKISDFLDNKCTKLDNILSKTRTSIDDYKKLKQAIITQAVTKGVCGNRPMKDSGIEWIGEIPAEWGITNIGRMCFVTKLAGFEFTNDMVANITDEGEVPIVRAQNIKMGRFLNPISEYISLQLSQKLNRCALDKKCLIITFIGAGIGEVAIFNEKKRYHLAPNVAKIVINDDKKRFISEEYLLYFLMSSAGQEEVNKIKKATAQPSISMETIRALKFIIPRTIREQEEIVAILDQKCAEIDTLIAKKTALLKEMENYKKSVIYEYVTGKKEV